MRELSVSTLHSKLNIVKITQQINRSRSDLSIPQFYKEDFRRRDVLVIIYQVKYDDGYLNIELLSLKKLNFYIYLNKQY